VYEWRQYYGEEELKQLGDIYKELLLNPDEDSENPELLID